MTNMAKLDVERKRKKILHYTIGRSGSAFISQILFHIFEEKNVWAGHEPVMFKLQPDQKLFITYRDFRDVVVSYWRSNLDIPLHELDKGRKITGPELTRHINSVKGFVSHHLAPTHKMNPSMVMKYEEFFPDRYDVIFSKIEKHTGIKLSLEERKVIKSKFNFKENKRRADAAGSFRKVGEEWMHGKHVYKGTVGGWKDLVPKEMHGTMNNQLGPLLEQWGYKV